MRYKPVFMYNIRSATLVVRASRSHKNMSLCHHRSFTAIATQSRKNYDGCVFVFPNSIKTDPWFVIIGVRYKCVIDVCLIASEPQMDVGNIINLNLPQSRYVIQPRLDVLWNIILSTLQFPNPNLGRSYVDISHGKMKVLRPGLKLHQMINTL